MRFLLVFTTYFFYVSCFSQTYSQIKNRYDNYLNYKGSLDKYVDISSEKITLYKYTGGKKEIDFVLTKSEWDDFAALCKTLTADSVEKIYQKKKTNPSYVISYTAQEKTPCNIPDKPLCEKRIIIDPGHMAGNMQMARIEQKYLHFTKENSPELKQDSIDIAEGVLTFQTASILKKLLEEKGAIVALTRKENSTTFGCCYDDWLKNYKKKTLDSLLKADKITKQKHGLLLKMNKNKFFLEFFKDYELVQRARVINNFKPDLTVIIHYNVNEKNVPWIKPSDKDFCMAFIPGCLIGDNLETTAGKINFLRLLLCDDADKSEKFSSLLVTELNKQLNVPIAKITDATYLSEHCMSTSSAGVYCRNLALCRLVQSPLMYGECLYQDNETECYDLIKNTETVGEIKTNKRVKSAAAAFFVAIIAFYSK
ncbi:MAG TPA: N-acetylmuramoyl-L-alanine amidase [Bacteroidia bacterium]|nr:N-acetylmuramoyl-L-alanine amidase [Bacteroidia bacterium]